MFLQLKFFRQFLQKLFFSNMALVRNNLYLLGSNTIYTTVQTESLAVLSRCSVLSPDQLQGQKQEEFWRAEPPLEVSVLNSFNEILFRDWTF